MSSCTLPALSASWRELHNRRSSIERAVELEMPAMALLDRNGVYGSARFHTSAKRNDIRAHVGAEIAVSSFGPRLTPPAWLPHQHIAEPARLPLLCESREGYQNLCQLITQFKMREKTKRRGRGHTRRCTAVRIRPGLPDGWRRRTSGSCADARRRRCWPRRLSSNWFTSSVVRMSMLSCSAIRSVRKSGGIRLRFALPDL